MTLQPRTQKRNYDSKKWREGVRVKLITHHGGKCQNCGVEFDGSNAVIFDFHHLDPKIKTFRWTNNHSLESRMKESEGCLLLCANCHRLVHSGKVDPSSLSLSLSYSGSVVQYYSNTVLQCGGE